MCRSNQRSERWLRPRCDDLRCMMQDEASGGAQAGAGSSADHARQDRRWVRIHEKFTTSPTKEGTTLEDMTGDSSSVGMWLRSSPFSVDKQANGKK